MRLPPSRIWRCCAPSRYHRRPHPARSRVAHPLNLKSSCCGVADWYAENKFYSPYYTESHVEFAAKVRAFVDAEIRPNVLKWYASRSLLLTDPRR